MPPRVRGKKKDVESNSKGGIKEDIGKESKQCEDPEEEAEENEEETNLKTQEEEVNKISFGR